MTTPLTINPLAFKAAWQGDSLALIAGALLPLAFAPFNIIPLAFVLPALLVWLLFDGTRGRSTWRGYLFGIGYFGVGVSWVAVSMVRFGGISMPLASLLTSLFVLIWAVFPALVAWCTHRFFRRLTPVLTVLLVVPGLWVLLEWVRGWLFTGFPWLSLGYSQTEGPLFGFAAMTGVYGVSWLVLFCSGLLLLAAVSPSNKNRLYFLALLAGVGLCSFIAGNISWTTPEGKVLKASLIQGNIGQDVKWLPEYRQSSIELYTQHTREHWDSDLIVWPETALPAYFHQAKPFLTELAAEAKQHNTDVLIGMPVLDADGSRRYYNSMVLVAEPFSFYHKQHLVPFGEFVPLKSLLGGFFAFFRIPMANFSQGDSAENTLPVAGLHAGISICYEDAFGEEVIAGMPKANLLVNVSNDAWFGESLAPHQHLQMAQMRSLETGRAMLRGTNNGISAIIDHRGDIIGISPQFKRHVLTADIQPMSGSTPYIVLGNSFVLIFCVLTLFLCVYIVKRPN